MGVDKPNYTQIPNLLLDDLFPLMAEAELRVTLTVARETFGYHRERAKLSLTELQELTRLSRQGVINGVESGLDRGTLCREKDDKGRYLYGIVVNGLTSQPSGLVNEVDQQGSQRSRPVVVNEVDQTSQPSRPILVNEVDQNTPDLKKKESIKEKQKEDDLPLPLVVDSAREAVHAAWRDEYGETMPANLIANIDGLTVECGPAAVIHGIVASRTSNSRTFGYIAKCARNYIPPAPQPPAPTYALNLPGVHRFEPPPAPTSPPAQPAAAPPARPAPLAHDDPWADGVAELCSEHPRFADWLPGSTLTATDAVRDGLPVYRLRVADARGVQWLETMSDAIRRKIGTLLRRRVLIEIVAAEAESEVVA